MTFTGPLEDRIAIQELVATYGDAVTRRDGDAWAGCWTEEATWDLTAIPGMGKVVGRAEIRSAWEAAMPGWPFQVNIATLGGVTIAGDRAEGRVYTHELTTDANGVSQRWTGQYDDVYVRKDGQWLIDRRNYAILHIGPA